MKILLFLLGLLSLSPDVWTAQAQPLPSTAYTRTFLRSADAATARSVLGVSANTNGTVSQLTVTNQLLFPTNAFPLSAGTTWDLSKPYQNIITNNDIAITAIGGLTNNAINWGILEYSNSAAATHFVDLSSLPWHVIGASSTNKVYVGPGKVAIISANIRGLASSNLVTAAQQ